MQYPTFLGFLLSLSLCGLLTSCVTTRNHPGDEKAPITPPQKKLGEKQEIHPDITSNPETEDLASMDIANFLTKFGRFDTAFEKEDRHAMMKMFADPVKQESPAEAALTIAILNSILNPSSFGLPAHPYKTKASFEEQDLNTTTKIDTKKISSSSTPSTETYCKNWNLDLPGAIEKNRLLNKHEVFQAVLKSFTKTINSEEFRKNVVDSMKIEVTLWAAFASTLGVFDKGALTGAALAETEANNNEFAAILPTQKTGAASTAQTDPPQNPSSSVDTTTDNDAAGSVLDAQTGSDILAEAQRLSEGGKYKEAVAKIRMIAPQNSIYSSAQERLKLTCNAAVQELRQKAAQSFQDSLSANDARSKSLYLQKAKQYLEEALNTFPEATGLSTVQENLSVISRNLEQLPTTK